MKKSWFLALVTLAGCGFGSPEAPLTIDNGCASDLGCTRGLCQANICIDDSGASVDVAIEVRRGSTDPQRAMPVSWAFAPESFSGQSRRDIALPATREVRGLVRWDGLPVPATLRFVRRMAGSVAPLAPVTVVADTGTEIPGADGPDGYDFSAVLVAGETYDVVVLPSTELVTMPMEESPASALRSLPPLYLELRIADGDLTEPLRFDVEFPADLANACEGSVDSGCTLEADVLSVDGELELPEAGLQVRAIDEATGRVVSSIAETDADGHFAIRIADAAPNYLIRVTSSAGRDPFPAVSIDPDKAFANAPDEKHVLIPRLSPVQFGGRVRDTNDSPVPGATVRFLSTGIFGGTQLGLEGSFSGSATTNEDGSFGVALLPGLYSLTVTPPEDIENAWGTLSADVLVSEDRTTTGTLVVPAQIRLQGRVNTFKQEPAVGVTVLARAQMNVDSSGVPRSKETVSNSLGGFALGLNPGLYDMHVKVPPETGFGWLVEPDVEISTERGDLVRTYRLDPPIPIEGILRTSDGVPLPGALIRAYVFRGTGTGTSRPVQIGETVSGEEGSYRLLIAPHLFGE